MKLLVKLLSYLRPIKLNSTEYKRNIRHFYKYKNFKYKNYINDIKVYKIKGVTTIFIYSHTPRVLIGKNAKYVLSLIFYLKKYLDEEIKVYIKNTKLWEMNN